MQTLENLRLLEELVEGEFKALREVRRQEKKAAMVRKRWDRMQMEELRSILWYRARNPVQIAIEEEWQAEFGKIAREKELDKKPEDGIKKCPVCYPVCYNTTTCILNYKCEHSFCKKCLTTWAKVSPMCRSS